MKKQNILLLMGFLTPSVVFAHGEEAVWYLAIVFFLSLILSLILLYLISRGITISDKFVRFVVLFFIEIGLLFLLTIMLAFILEILIVHVF
jgi:hypothetical protein